MTAKTQNTTFLIWTALFVCSALAVVFVVRFLFRKLQCLLLGWSRVAAAFPARDLSDLGELYPGCTGAVGYTTVVSAFRVVLDLNGLAVTPSFARCVPIFIPWTAVSRIEAAQTTIVIRVDYMRSLWFRLPRGALEIIKSRVPFVVVVGIT